MLRLGFDAKRLFNNFTGLGNYSRTLLSNLSTYYPDQAYFLYTPKVKNNEETHFFLNSALFNVQMPKRGGGPLWRSSLVKRDLKKHKIQLFHGLSNEIPLGLNATNIKSVVSIHDLIFKRYPDHYPFIDRSIYDLKCKYACKNADHVIAISESTKQDIIDYYKVPEEKISVIYQSCHERYMLEKTRRTLELVRQRYQLPDSFMLTVGSVTERKNLMGIVEALRQIPEGQRIPLVVVGKGGAYKQKVIQFIQSNRLGKWVQFVDVDFDDLPGLYQTASLFLYPSFYEGFGIPVLESLFSGTPVITSNVSSLPEAGGEGACLVDPANAEEISHAMLRILEDSDYRKRLITKGYDHAEKFKGEPLTHQLMDVYEQLVGEDHITPEPIT
jgi:glycosyltransferase involved in cell wall biosynthesis